MRAGTVWINTYNIYDAGAPFGGYKQSASAASWARRARRIYADQDGVGGTVVNPGEALAGRSLGEALRWGKRRPCRLREKAVPSARRALPPGRSSARFQQRSASPSERPASASMPYESRHHHCTPHSRRTRRRRPGRVRPDDLARGRIRAVVERDGLDPHAHRRRDPRLREPGRRGQPQRRADGALLAGLPVEVPGQTVNRLCGSGLQAVASAAQAIKAGEGDVFIAGGVESMTARRT